MQDLSRDMGKHGAQIENLEREVNALRADIREIREILDQANGGWRVLMWVAGASSASGAVISWFASKMHLTQ